MQTPENPQLRPERMKELFRTLKDFDKGALFDHEESALSKAVAACDLDEVARLLDDGAEIDEPDWHGNTPLMDAVRFGGRGEEGAKLRSLLKGNLSDAVKRGREEAAKPGGEPRAMGETLRKFTSILPSASEVRERGREANEKKRASADAGDGSRDTELTAEEIGVVRLLVERGASLVAADREGHMALHLAASCGAANLIDLLLDAGAPIDAGDKNGKTPLFLAAEECRPAAVERLLARGANVHARTHHGGTPLMSAALGGSKRVIRALLARGANVAEAADDGTTPLLCAAMQGYQDVVELLRDAGAEVGPLESLVLDEPFAGVSKAAQSRTWGRGVAMWAARNSRPEVIRRLHTLGVSMNQEDSRGRTPMQVASVHGDPDMVQALLECGAGCGTTPVGTGMKHMFSPLRWAASMGDLEKVRMLIAGGADVNETTEDGDTPLTGAVMRANVEVARILLEAGADPNDLVVEIVSPNDRPGNLRNLEAEYRSIGVQEIVFWDCQKGGLTVLRKRQGDYAVETLKEGEWHSEAVAGFHLDVAGMFADPLPNEMEVLSRLLAE